MKIIKKVILTMVLGLLCMGAEAITEAEVRAILETVGTPGVAISVQQQILERDLRISLRDAKSIANDFYRKGGWNAVKDRVIPHLTPPAVARTRTPSPVDAFTFQQEQAARKKVAARHRWRKIRNVGLAVSGFHSRRRRAEAARIANLPPPPPEMLAPIRSRSPSPDRRGRARSRSHSPEARSRSSSRGRSRSRSGSSSSWVHVRVPSPPPGPPPALVVAPPPPPPPPASLSNANPPQGRLNMANLFSGGVPKLKKTGGPQRRSSSPSTSEATGFSLGGRKPKEYEQTPYQIEQERLYLIRLAEEQRSFQQEQARRAQIARTQATVVTHTGGPPPPPPPLPPPGMMNQGGGFLAKGRDEQAAKKKSEAPKGFAMSDDVLRDRLGTLSRGRPRVAPKPKKKEESEFDKMMHERKEKAARSKKGGKPPVAKKPFRRDGDGSSTA